MTSDELREKLENIKFFIQDAEVTVRNGSIVDLAGLDKNVGALCSRMLKLPADQARDLQPLMAEVIGDLERLGIALKDYKDDLKKK